MEFDVNTLLNTVIGVAIFLGKYEFKVIKTTLTDLQKKLENVNVDNATVKLSVENLQKEVEKTEVEIEKLRENQAELKEMILMLQNK